MTLTMNGTRNTVNSRPLWVQQVNDLYSKIDNPRDKNALLKTAMNTLFTEKKRTKEVMISP